MEPFVVAAGWVTEPVAPATRHLLHQIAEAAGDRIKTAGDILDYEEFFRDDSQLVYDAKLFDKRVRAGDSARVLRLYREQLATLEPFDAPAAEACLRRLLEAEGVKIGEVIHALRVAVTGKAVGLGMFDCLAILGRGRVLSRIDRALAML
jgi:glutamyl-tRNA synthetase